MLELLRNLRLPGRRGQAYRSPRPARRPASEAMPARRFALGRAERPKPRRQIHVPWRRIGMMTGAFAVIGGLLYGSAWLLTGDTFRVLEIDVSGAQVETPHGIAWASGVGRQSMLTVNLDDAASRVMDLPGVKSVEVTRAWPRRVQIDVIEHQAWGYWQTGSSRLVIDEHGRTLEAARPAPEGAATIIELGAPGQPAELRADPDTVRLVARLHAEGVFDRLDVQPSGFVFRPNRGLTVVVDGGPDITFGDSSNYEFKVRALQSLGERIDEAELEAQEIDLRFGRNVVLR